MIFETKELYTQMLSPSDAARFHQVCTQPYILKWMDDWDMGFEQVQGLINHFIKGYEINDPEKHPYILGIWHKADNKFIGICGFGPKEELGGKTEIAYFIDENYSHRGYMTQIVDKATEFFFSKFDKPFLCALVDEDNSFSKKILLNSSFQFHQVTDHKNLLKSHYRLFR
jgi:RimJ/RimL family protein N-acetyltransferase